MTLLADVNLPGSQEDLASNWEPACSLVEHAISAADFAPRLLAQAVARQSLCLLWGEGPVHSRLALLWYSLSVLFCELVRQCFRLDLLAGKFSLSPPFFILSLAIPVWVAISGSVSRVLWKGTDLVGHAFCAQI